MVLVDPLDATVVLSPRVGCSGKKVFEGKFTVPIKETGFAPPVSVVPFVLFTATGAMVPFVTITLELEIEAFVTGCSLPATCAIPTAAPAATAAAAAAASPSPPTSAAAAAASTVSAAGSSAGSLSSSSSGSLFVHTGASKVGIGGGGEKSSSKSSTSTMEPFAMQVAKLAVFKQSSLETSSIEPLVVMMFVVRPVGIVELESMVVDRPVLLEYEVVKEGEEVDDGDVFGARVGLGGGVLASAATVVDIDEEVTVAGQLLVMPGALGMYTPLPPTTSTCPFGRQSLPPNCAYVDFHITNVRRRALPQCILDNDTTVYCCKRYVCEMQASQRII